MSGGLGIVGNDVLKTVVAVRAALRTQAIRK